MPHKDILALMRRSAIFAAPSRYEPFGLAVVEAAISGAALVLADIPTFRELWSNAALFVFPDDSAGWSRAVTELAEDSVLRGRLSAEAGARARQFTLSRQSARLYALYSTLTTPAVAA
jgi:glycosyltransferase involved in cell wall biosynthesis